MDGHHAAILQVTAEPASDSWGFVGVVSIGDVESYRTIRAHPTPEEAVRAAQCLLGDVLGALMAGQEWRTAAEEFGHPPQRTELGFGLTARREDAARVRRTDDDRDR